MTDHRQTPQQLQLSFQLKFLKVSEPEEHPSGEFGPQNSLDVVFYPAYKK